MAGENLSDLFPELKEVENKLGRKTPESLLTWMKDAAICGDVADWGAHSSAFSGSLPERIASLRQEMRWLRSADVRILRQLVAVHEGIEAMRWLMEERGALVSQGSSVTSSLNSLVTAEEHAPSVTYCRESQSCLQDLIETAGEHSVGHRSPHNDEGDSNHDSYLDDSGSVSANLKKSQSQHWATEDIKVNAGTIKRALLRSRKSRKEVKDSSFTVPMETTKVLENNMAEEEKSASKTEMFLLGYDAQWCWVQSPDDVTFL